MVKRVNSFEGFMGMASEMARGTREFRNDVLRKETKDYIVDTVCATFDTGMWETGISQDNERTWTIVEQYDDRNEATIGHNKWIRLMQENHKRKLEDLNLWDG